MSRLLESARRPLKACLLLAFIFATPAAIADSGLLNGSLGRWLDTEVLPELSRTLGQHPRFKGETIKLVSLHGGQPTDRASRLHQAIEAHITQRLLKSPGVRIAWTDQPRNSCGVSEQAVYLLGVEIESDGPYYHKLNIGMIDVAESVWVSGVNHTWRGRLAATEQAAFSQPVLTAPSGTVDSPLPIGSSREIAQAMHEHLRCAHPQGLDGPVYLATSDNADLNRVLASLRVALATAPLAAVTSDQTGAEWVLSLSSTGAGTGSQVQQLGLLLTEQSRETTQQVATVYASGMRTRTTAYPTEQIADDGRSTATAYPPAATAYPPAATAYPPAATAYPPAATAYPSTTHSTELLSPLRLFPAADQGICDTRKARGNQCAEVTFDLRTPAYLFVLSSSNRSLSTSACGSNLVKASSGERRFRIRVPSSVSDHPDAGVYAIAVSDRSAAKKLSRHIRTGICSRPLASSDTWLRKLDELLSDHPVAIQWRAIHLSHTPGGVARL